ncbi:MAG: energy transducer TonB [Rhodanobacter sp.]
MKTMLQFLFVLMLLVATACMAGQDWTRFGPPMTAALDVDAQGHVLHAQLLGKDVLPQLQTLTEQTTRDWRFVPATVDGKPAPARTYAVFYVQMRKLDGNQQLRLHYVLHGPGSTFQSPSYPREMARQLVQALVVVAFDVNGDGSVSNVHVATAKTTDGVRGAAFYKISIDAVEKGKYLPELVDSRPVITHMRVPITFSIGRYAVASVDLRQALDAPHDKAAKNSVDVTHFADVPVALDSPLRLVTTQP